MRFYGFDVSELTTPSRPDLSLDIDPKLAWALRHRENFPVDLNRAPREVLLRIPGLGVRNVERILRVRRWHQLRLADLVRLRVPLSKLMPFVVVADYKPRSAAQLEIAPARKQLNLFGATETSVVSGEL